MFRVSLGGLGIIDNFWNKRGTWNRIVLRYSRNIHQPEVTNFLGYSGTIAIIYRQALLAFIFDLFARLLSNTPFSVTQARVE